MKKLISAVMMFVLTLSVALPASAEERLGNGVILSAYSIEVAENAPVVLAAALPEGLDASRLACVSADINVASVTPVISVNNVANFQVDYVGDGSTVIAIYHMDNPSVVAYVTVQSAAIFMNIPAKLGTNKENYCTLTSYEFVPYEFHKYANFNDYKSTLKLSYRCDSYEDDGYVRWGCYGYFYDAAGNVLSRVHLYAGSLAKGRIYDSEFDVPVNAVRFSIEGF